MSIGSIGGVRWHAGYETHSHGTDHILTKTHHVLKVEASGCTIVELMVGWQWEMAVAVCIGPRRSNVRGVEDVSVY